jgi:hypothetical protein
MKTRSFMLLMALIIFKAFAEEEITYVQIQLGESYVHYREVVEKYKEIWIGYSTSNREFASADTGEKYFVIDSAFYFYKKDGKYVLLGSLNKDGFYDKNNICLKKTKVSSDYNILGISSSLFENPLGPALVIQSKSKPDEIRRTNAFVIVDFDTNNDSVKIMEFEF